MERKTHLNLGKFKIILLFFSWLELPLLMINPYECGSRSYSEYQIIILRILTLTVGGVGCWVLPPPACCYNSVSVSTLCQHRDLNLCDNLIIILSDTTELPDTNNNLLRQEFCKELLGQQNLGFIEELKQVQSDLNLRWLLGL